MAREISTQRDYVAVKEVVSQACRSAAVLFEPERIDALIRELADYEDRLESAAVHASAGPEAVRRIWRASFLRRRWSDE
jgi:hypothetical protein